MTLPLPGDIVVGPPQFSSPVVQTPSTAGVTLVPVAGPVGPQGPPGDAAASLAFVQNVPSPMTSVTVNHGLAFHPSGIVCLEADGNSALIGVGVSYPSVGQVVLTFGVPFTGTIYFS